MMNNKESRSEWDVIGTKMSQKLIRKLQRS